MARTITIAVPAHAVARRVVMKDALSVEQFKMKLDALKQGGLFHYAIPGDPKKPNFAELSFLCSGNYLLVVGDPKWVDAEIENIRLMAFLYYGERLRKSAGMTVGSFRDALSRTDCPLPQWVTLRMRRSLELTERLYSDLSRKQAQESLQELERRFRLAQQRVLSIQQSLAHASTVTSTKSGTAQSNGSVERQLLDLKSVTEELVSVPLALFDAVGAVLDASAPTEAQLIHMFEGYTHERTALDKRLETGNPASVSQINYARLETLEAGLNLWLRRASEAMSRALEQQFYSRYSEQIRLLANKRLGKSSGRDILSSSNIEDVPDIARDLLMADTEVNIFVSNSVSMQFAPDTTNSVSAQVQSRLPSNLSLPDRVEQAEKAATSLEKLSKQYEISGEEIVKTLLAGGQAVPVQAGISLSANPSIGFDASTVSLALTANQTLAPNSTKVTDRVTNHSIDNATVTVLSYEPMVLSTLTSNISYFENTGGIPVLKRVPFVKDLLNDVGPLKEGKRVRGVYQSSVIILEPVVIPTIEDLVRFHSGWGGSSALLTFGWKPSL